MREIESSSKRKWLPKGDIDAYVPDACDFWPLYNADPAKIVERARRDGYYLCKDAVEAELRHRLYLVRIAEYGD